MQCLRQQDYILSRGYDVEIERFIALTASPNKNASEIIQFELTINFHFLTAKENPVENGEKRGCLVIFPLPRSSAPSPSRCIFHVRQPDPKPVRVNFSGLELHKGDVDAFIHPHFPLDSPSICLVLGIVTSLCRFSLCLTFP